METEEQQVEELRKWWKENGSSIITGVILGLAMLFAVKSWFAWQDRKAAQASDIYTVMMNGLEQGDKKAASDNAGLLITDFSGTPYASLAALALASFRIEDGDLEAARTQLQWVLDNGASDELRNIGRLRLARVLISLQDYDGAITLLDQLEAGSGQDAVFTELRGDIHSLRGEMQQAVDAYQIALTMMAQENPGRNLVQQKYDHAAALAVPAGDTAQ